MEKFLKQGAARILAYAAGRAGSLMPAFALLLPVIIGSVGMSMDMGQAYLVRQRLGGALDASALAAAAAETEEDAIRSRVEDFFEANYPEEKIGTAYDLDVEVSDEDIIVSASADYKTSFMRVLGVDTLTVKSRATVHREVRGLEVVLVLDNTGSMATNDNIGALRTASQNFVNILFERAGNPEDIKIGLVPYANSVRVGRYGLGQNPDGTTYGDGSVFVTLPSGVTYSTSHDTTNQSRWYGCVIEHNPSGWNINIGNNDPYPDDVSDDYEGPWDIYRYSDRTSSTQQQCTGTGKNKQCTYVTTYGIQLQSQVNSGCPYANILPLSSDQDDILADINTMQAHGSTLGNIGMVWGYRLLSPDKPFTEGHDWDSQRWKKAVVMMTDGDNTMDSKYSSFWLTDANNITVSTLNSRYAEVCEALKEKGVLIYTVTFTSNISENTKDFYRDCATTPSQYYDAPTQEQLINVFEQISRELSTLHISN